jgi:hypothetical protein
MRNTDAGAFGAVTIAALLLIGSSLPWTQSAFALPNNETGVTSSFSCECYDAGGKKIGGSCTWTSTPHGGHCDKSSDDTCAGECDYISTTSGITGRMKPVAPSSAGTKEMP